MKPSWKFYRAILPTRVFKPSALLLFYFCFRLSDLITAFGAPAFASFCEDLFLSPQTGGGVFKSPLIPQPPSVTAPMLKKQVRAIAKGLCAVRKVIKPLTTFQKTCKPKKPNRVLQTIPYGSVTKWTKFHWCLFRGRVR